MSGLRRATALALAATLAAETGTAPAFAAMVRALDVTAPIQAITVVNVPILAPSALPTPSATPLAVMPPTTAPSFALTPPHAALAAAARWSSPAAPARTAARDPGAEAADAGRWFDASAPLGGGARLSADENAPGLGPTRLPRARVEVDPMSAPGEVWIVFEAGINRERAEALAAEQGLSALKAAALGPLVALRALAPDAARAANAAKSLAAAPGVRKLSVHPETRRLMDAPLKPPVAAPAAPTAANVAMNDEPESTPAAEASESPSPPAETSPSSRDAAATPPAKPAMDLPTVRRFVEALLAQGDKREHTARIAAAELLAALSTPADLSWARDKIARGGGHVTRYQGYPERLAAGWILARHGSPAEDGPRLLDALADLAENDAHLYNAPKAGLIESYALLAERAGPEEIAALPERYRRMRAETRPSEQKDDSVLDALYAALCRSGGPELKPLLINGEREHRMRALFEYLKRAHPAHLRKLARAMRLDSGYAPHSALDLLAWAESATASDLETFRQLLRLGWGSHFGIASRVEAAQAFGRLVARLSAFDRARDELRSWLGGDLTKDADCFKMNAAIEAAGEAGGTAELPLLEAIFGANPQSVSYGHEISQAAAASAWARIVVRTGQWRRYATEPEGGGPKPLPRLQRMLADPHPIVNKAALETFTLLKEGGRI